MEMSIVKYRIIPLVAFVSCLALWAIPAAIDPYEILIAVVIVVTASVFQYGRQAFNNLGLSKGHFSFKNVLVAPFVYALILFLVYFFILIPLVTSFTEQAIDYSAFKNLQGNIFYALLALLYIWISAAFGEEIVWRGYFMRQFSHFFGKRYLSLGINAIFFASLFGYFHSYQGLTGQIITGIIGALLALIFILKKYNLWFVISVHGFFDTFALIMLYNGWL